MPLESETPLKVGRVRFGRTFCETPPRVNFRTVFCEIPSKVGKYTCILIYRTTLTISQ